MAIADWLDTPTRPSGGIARSEFAKALLSKMKQFGKVSFEIGEPMFYLLKKLCCETNKLKKRKCVHHFEFMHFVSKMELSYLSKITTVEPSMDH